MSNTKEELSEMGRIQRLIDFNQGVIPGVARSAKNVKFRSELSKDILGSRAPEERTKGWLAGEDRAKGLYLTDGKLTDPEKGANRLSKTQDYVGSYYNWNGPLAPEYKMEEPMAIFDTESYVKQTINRRLSLMFRNGYEVVGRDRDVQYINDRISTMEFVSNRSFRSLMKKIMFNLFLQANCFLLKIRKEGATTLTNKDDKIPVSSYVIIPAHQIQPIMKGGIINKWRRYYDTGKYYDEYAPSEIIHFTLDRKNWHIFGTPRTIAVREDIFALRRLEENTELLFINYLFPLFHVTVGTELNPATYTDEGTSELELIKYQIENMPKEGVFVTDERSKVVIIGANGKELDFMSLLNYYKARVFAGLGMSEMDMGSASHGGSAASDNISQNLKDSIKADVEEFADQVKMFIFKEWLLEANYSVSVQSALEELELTFHEIDLDNKIKDENHTANLYNSNLITLEEARKRMKLKPLVDESGLQIRGNQAWIAKYTADIETKNQILLLKAQKALGMAGTDESNHTTTTHKVATSATGGKSVTHTIKAPPKNTIGKGTSQAGIQNIVTPTNQHGTKIGPKKLTDALVEILTHNLVPACEFLSDYTDSDWKSYSSELIDTSISEFELLELDDSEDSSYTKHLQEEIINLKDLVSSVNDPEELVIVLEHYFNDGNEEELNPQDEELNGY